MNAATVRVLSSSNDAVSVPTVPVCVVPGLKLELEATQWAERLFATAKTASGDAARFAAGL